MQSHILEHTKLDVIQTASGRPGLGQGHGWFFHSNSKAAASVDRCRRVTAGTRHFLVPSIISGKWAVRPSARSEKRKEVLEI